LFYEEIEHLIKNNLIKGGSLENAIVIRDDAVLTTEAAALSRRICAAQDARHRRRFVAGREAIRGHLIAVKPSHTANCEFAKLIQAQMNKPLARGAGVRSAAGCA